jgi:hypothetical protein
MTPSTWAKDLVWCRHHTIPTGDTEICEGLGLSPEQYSTVKAEAINKVDQIYPHGVTVFGKSRTTKHHIIENVSTLLPLVDPNKAPKGWFGSAAISIAQRARETVLQRETEGQNRIGQVQSLTNDGDGEGTPRPICARKVSTPRLSTSPSRVVNKQRKIPIVVMMGYDTPAELIELTDTSTITGDDGKPPFGLLMDSISPFLSNSDQATYIGQWRGITVAIRNDSTLQRVIH